MGRTRPCRGRCAGPCLAAGWGATSVLESAEPGNASSARPGTGGASKACSQAAEHEAYGLGTSRRSIPSIPPGGAALPAAARSEALPADDVLSLTTFCRKN